jgi:hypothetical protein
MGHGERSRRPTSAVLFFKLASASCAIPTREQAMQDFKAQWLETLLGRDAKGSVL